MNLRYLEKCQLDDGTKKSLAKFDDMTYESKVSFFENVIFNKNMYNDQHLSPIFDYEVIKLYIWIKYDIVQISERKFNTLNYGDAKQNYAVYRHSKTRKFITIYELDELVLGVWSKILNGNLYLHWSKRLLLPTHLYGMFGEYKYNILKPTDLHNNLVEYRLDMAKAKFKGIRIFTDNYEIKYSDANHMFPIIDDDNSATLDYVYLGAPTMRKNKETFMLSSHCAQFEPLYYNIISSTKEWVMGLMISDRYDIIRDTTISSRFKLHSYDYSPRLQFLDVPNVRFIKKHSIEIEGVHSEEQLLQLHELGFDAIRANVRLYGIIDNNKKLEILQMLSDIESYSKDEIYDKLDSLDDYFILRTF